MSTVTTSTQSTSKTTSVAIPTDAFQALQVQTSSPMRVTGTGLLFLGGAAIISNPSRHSYDLYAQSVATSPTAGNSNVSVGPLTLVPNQSLSIPTPPANSYWQVVAVPSVWIRRIGWDTLLISGTIGFFASWGAWDMVVDIYRWTKKRHQTRRDFREYRRNNR